MFLLLMFHCSNSSSSWPISIKFFIYTVIDNFFRACRLAQLKISLIMKIPHSVRTTHGTPKYVKRNILHVVCRMPTTATTIETWAVILHEHKHHLYNPADYLPARSPPRCCCCCESGTLLLILELPQKETAKRIRSRPHILILSCPWTGHTAAASTTSITTAARDSTHLLLGADMVRVQVLRDG